MRMHLLCRMIAKVVSTELLTEIAKMIVDGAISLAPSPIHSLFTFTPCAGKVKPVTDSVYKFDDVLSAYDKLMTGHARGKIVIEVA